MNPWIGGALAFAGVQLFVRAAQGRPSDPFLRPEGAPVRILLFEAHDEQSRKIDRASGGYGYSHSVLDAGELSLDTAEPLIIDCRPCIGVFRRPLRDYDGRGRVEIELPYEVGEHAYGYVRGQIGRPFDSLGFFGSDRHSMFCSKLIWESLPQRYRGYVLSHSKKGAFGWYASVNAIPSPNQLAVAFGVAKPKDTKDS